MNARIENGKPIFYGEPVKVNYTAVTGAEDMVVSGHTVKRLTGEKTEYTLTADQMNAIGWTVDDSFSKPHWKLLEDTKEAFFHKASCNASIRGDIDSMKSSMADLADSFFEGKITESELADRFQSMAEKFINVCREKQYPFPALCGMDEAELSFAYDCFRGAILKSAVQHNNAEGRALTSKVNFGWHYYNADYYYKSESAIGALSERVKSMAADRGFKEFGIPDYKSIGKNSLYNFNSAVSGEWDYIPGSPVQPVNEKWILDFDAVPPEGFKWFMETGGHEEQCRIVEDGADIPGGMETRVWAMYKDMLVSDSFRFSLGQDLPSDVRNLGDLLQFHSKVKDDVAAVNGFLKNFQAAPRWYFTNMGRRETAGRRGEGWNMEA